MIGDEIYDQADVSRMQGCNEAVEIVERAVDWIDAAEIRDVVTEIEHWGRVDRRQPDRIDAEPAKMVDAFDQPRQIALAVAVAVLKGNRCDFIDDGAPPPLRILNVRPRGDAAAEATGSVTV